MCMGGCGGGGTTNGKGRSGPKNVISGHRPLSHTKKLSLPTSKPKVKFGSVKFGSRK